MISKDHLAIHFLSSLVCLCLRVLLLLTPLLVIVRVDICETIISLIAQEGRWCFFSLNTIRITENQKQKLTKNLSLPLTFLCPSNVHPIPTTCNDSRLFFYRYTTTTASNLKAAFVLVCLNRFQQITTCHTFQAPNEAVKMMWLMRLRDTADRWKRTLQNSVFRSQQRMSTASTMSGGSTIQTRSSSIATQVKKTSVASQSMGSSAISSSYSSRRWCDVMMCFHK